MANGDIIADTRVLSNQVQTTLRQLAADPSSKNFVNRVIQDNDNICLSSIEEGIAQIEAATQLLERSGNDVKTLIAKLNSLGALADPAADHRHIGMPVT